MPLRSGALIPPHIPVFHVKPRLSFIRPACLPLVSDALDGSSSIFHFLPSLIYYSARLCYLRARARARPSFHPSRPFSSPVLLLREARLGWISRSGLVRGVRDRYSDQRKRESLRRSLPETRELRQFTLTRLRRTNIPSNFHPAVNSHDIRQVIRDDTPNDLFPNGAS